MAVDISGYKVVKTLGKGGMATVYLAVQEIFEREIALKVMSKGLSEDPEFGQRFMREAQIVSNLIHPNIVTVYDVGLENGSYYLSMEYINGADLKKVRKQLSFMEKLQAVRDIASALDMSGSKGYVHRDIKPENIMIERGTKRAILMDFGIARASETDVSVTQAGTAIGTPHYMSPEQAKGDDIDSRADLYSLGVVLFYLMAGYVPFEGDSAVAIGIRHITEAVPELPSHLKDLQWFIDKAMAKDPNNRFQTGAEFVNTLNSLDLKQLEALYYAESNLNNSTDAETETPTTINAGAAHQYGNSSTLADDEPEDFTLSFKTQSDEPQALNLKWPLYVALSCISLLLIGGVYLVATHKPANKPSNTTIVQQNPNAQNAIANLIIGRSDLTQEQTAQLKSLQASIEQAHQAYKKSPTEDQLRTLVALYQNLKVLSQNHSEIQRAIDMLADGYVKLILPAFNQGDFVKAQKQLSLVLELFPQYSSSDLVVARTQISMRSKLESLLKEGGAYLKEGQLTQPGGKNAAESYRTALHIAPALKPAKEGLKRVARSLVTKASAALKQSDNSSARHWVNAALLVVPNYAPALAMEKQLLNSAKPADKIQTLFEQAERHIEGSQFFTPKDQNAHASYVKILALDKHNKKAITLKANLPKRLESAALALVNQGDYQVAKTMTEQATLVQPRNAELMVAALNVDEAITSHRYQTQPRVGEIRASGVNNVRLGLRQPRVITIKDKIFFKFDYHNFKINNSLVTAHLYRSDQQTALGSKQVIVQGQSGQNEFVFDLPRNFSSTGEYRIELELEGNIIANLVFRIG